jgi:predicted enzyme related to lactoylglutathione lyase
MSRVVHFEIHAEDPERCLEFYKSLFSWQFTKWDGPVDYWLIVTGSDSEPGINGGLVKRRGPAPTPGQAVNAYVCTVSVSDLDASLANGHGLGAAVAVPKMAVPGVGWLAYLTDPEGNIFGLMQRDPNAK